MAPTKQIQTAFERALTASEIISAKTQSTIPITSVTTVLLMPQAYSVEFTHEFSGRCASLV